jgi:hypothetical protein
LLRHFDFPYTPASSLIRASHLHPYAPEQALQVQGCVVYFGIGHSPFRDQGERFDLEALWNSLASFSATLSYPPLASPLLSLNNTTHRFDLHIITIL